jgi:hypothetical protein
MWTENSDQPGEMLRFAAGWRRIAAPQPGPIQRLSEEAIYEEEDAAEVDPPVGAIPAWDSLIAPSEPQ